jgi:DNA-binding CsgD family transcriptional regulator
MLSMIAPEPPERERNPLKAAGPSSLRRLPRNRVNSNPSTQHPADCIIFTVTFAGHMGSRKCPIRYTYFVRIEAAANSPIVVRGLRTSLVARQKQGKRRKNHAAVGIARSVAPATGAVEHRRQLFADFCRMLGNSLKAPAPRAASAGPMPMPNLSPRMKQTLERLLAGDSEKQIARHLGLSRHTVHVYVKAIYRGFEVSSRGELLARFVRLPS